MNSIVYRYAIIQVLQEMIILRVICELVNDKKKDNHLKHSIRSYAYNDVLSIIVYYHRIQMSHDFPGQQQPFIFFYIFAIHVKLKFIWIYNSNVRFM